MTMDTAEVFTAFLDNLKVDNSDKIADRRDEIAKALNKEIRDVTGSVSNQLMVGSYGRYTAIRGISDLDMLYILPDSLREQYESETGPRRILNRVRDAIRGRYTTTEVVVDQCVVRVQFNNFKFEVQPVFEEDDRTFLYPDTVAEKWKVTKPRAEIAETRECDLRTSGNMRKLAKMTRAWRNAHGVVMAVSSSTPWRTASSPTSPPTTRRQPTTLTRWSETSLSSSPTRTTMTTTSRSAASSVSTSRSASSPRRRRPTTSVSKP